MASTPYTIALVQMACDASAEENLNKATGYIRKAKDKGAAIVCLPELFLGPYFCQVEDINQFDRAEPIPGPTTQTLGELAKELEITLLVSLFEKRAPGLHHNSLAIIAPDGKLQGTYRKMHIPHDPLFFEKYYFTPGDTGFMSADTPQGRIGTLVCWDQWYPEAARVTAMMGAEVLFYPTAIGWHPSEKAEWGETQQNSWQTIQRSHAIANGVFVAACNRIGHEVLTGDGIEFFGHSFIADPYGRIIAQASSDKEEIITATIDPALMEEARRNWPFLRDRRVDAYSPLTQRFLG